MHDLEQLLDLLWSAWKFVAPAAWALLLAVLIIRWGRLRLGAPHALQVAGAAIKLGINAMFLALRIYSRTDRAPDEQLQHTWMIWSHIAMICGVIALVLLAIGFYWESQILVRTRRPAQGGLA